MRRLRIAPALLALCLSQPLTVASRNTFETQRPLPFVVRRFGRIRGGSSEQKTAPPTGEDLIQQQVLDGTEVRQASAEEIFPSPKRRRTSDVILDLIDASRSGDDEGLSSQLRMLMMERRDQVLGELREGQTHRREDGSSEAPLHAIKRLLHFLAPKITAIKHSPDVSLTVRCLPSDEDPGLAASLVATIAHLWEIQNLSARQGSSVPGPSNATALLARGLVHDRRFEQLIETIVCGVDLSKRAQEEVALQVHHHEADDLVQMIRGAELHHGLSIRDSCRAAWGVAMLGLYEIKMVGETKMKDLILALALRVRELLLARVRLLCTDDFFVENSTVPVEDRIEEIVREIAEDTATAMWAFGCVQAVTGVKCAPLIHVCTCIFCADPFQTRKSVQEGMATLDEPVIGGNDVIDKLDRAERVEGSPRSPESLDTQRNEDVFLDFLSPTEVTDVLWALGVYTMKEPSPIQSVGLLSEIAVDRVVEWLAHDLKHGRSSTNNAPAEMEEEEDEDSRDETVDQECLAEKCVADVGDSQKLVTVQSPEGVVESDRVCDVEYVEVADAAAILASENNDVVRSEAEGETIIRQSLGETMERDVMLETVDAAKLLEAEESFENGTPAQTQSGFDSDPLTNYFHSKESIDWLFSAHDLCSLSWAVTELDDSLKGRTTRMVADLLIFMGRDHLARCSSADHANLVWAMAKECEQDTSRSTPNFYLLGRWIAEDIFQSSGLADAVIDSDSWSLLRNLQPPELSRLLWSLASLSMTAEDDQLSKLVGVLSLAGLETASRNFHMFSTEDLARISWAFVEFSDYGAVLETHPSSLQSLGQMLGLIDMSLISWEVGHSYAMPNISGEQRDSSKEENRFTSFFGRARSHIPKFERKMEEPLEDSEEYHSPLVVEEKARRPFLKDFPVDPSTLCKLTGSLSRPDVLFSEACDTQTMTKVILRLMTSRNGRLLGECNIYDLTALCVAAVRSRERELVGLFARRAVRMLNDHPSLIRSATPLILSRLLSALGDLGVKYHAPDNSTMAYRRLQLTTRLPVHDGFAMKKLSDESLRSLSRGLAMLNATSCNEDFVVAVLQELEQRMPEYTACLGDLLETVSNFYLLVNSLNYTNTNPRDDEGPSAMEQIHRYTTTLLNGIADATTQKLRYLTASDLRIIVQHFVALPFRADHLMSVVEEEIAQRLSSAETRDAAAVGMRHAMQSLTPEVVKQLVEIKKSNSAKKLLCLFGKDKQRDGDDNDKTAEPMETKGLLGDLTDVILSAVQLRDCEQDYTMQTSDRIEYGRLGGLLSQYRRIDFASGARLSRFDREGQRWMAKQMMSRLLPL